LADAIDRVALERDATRSAVIRGLLRQGLQNLNLGEEADER